MPFAPRELPSGRYQGGFAHPVTKRHITKVFDQRWEAEVWAVASEREAKLATTMLTAKPIESDIRESLRTEIWAEAMLCADAAANDQPDKAKDHALEMKRLRRILLASYQEGGAE